MILVNFKNLIAFVKSLRRPVLEIFAYSSKFRKDQGSLFLKVALICWCCAACGAQSTNDDFPNLVRANETPLTEVRECETEESSDCVNLSTETEIGDLSTTFATRNDDQGRSEESSAEPSEIQYVELTLQEAIASALKFNRRLINQRLDREAQRIQLELEEDRWSPRYSISPSFANSPNSRSARFVSNINVAVPTGGTFGVSLDGPSADGNRAETLERISFTLSHPLLRGAGSEVATVPIRQARIAEESNVLNLRQAVADLVVQVEQGYRSLIQTYQRLEIAEGAMQRAKNQQNITKALIEAGRAARRELIRSEATLANRELSLARARNGLERQNYTFVNLVGLGANIRIRPTDELQAPEREVSRVPQLKDVLSRRTDYRLAELALVRADISLMIAENNLLPSVALGLNADHRDGEITGPRLTLSTTIQLNDRRPKLAHLQARNAKRKAEGDLAERRRSIEINLRQAVTSVEEGLWEIELATNARELAEENLAIERNKFDQGLSSAFQVSSLGDELVSAEQAEVNAVISYLNALTALDQATGLTLEQRGIQLDATSQ